MLGIPHEIRHVVVKWPATPDELFWLAERLPRLEILEATNSAPIDLSDTRQLTFMIRNLRIIDVNPSGDRDEWAEYMNAVHEVAKFTFGHHTVAHATWAKLKYPLECYICIH